MANDDMNHYDFVTIAESLEHATPQEVIAWTLAEFGSDVTFACSFEDVALLHMLHEQLAAVEVLFLDTGGHFAESYEFVSELQASWELNIRRVVPGSDADAVPCGTGNCCELRKVTPLQRAVQGRRAWFTGVKRVDAPTRAGMPVVSWDEKFGLVKVNPLATWSDDDVAYYLESKGLPEHPLWAQGYASIGCAAVTVKPLLGQDRRSGRWAGSEKEECGLHEG